MARALFLGLPLTGHINPSLSLTRELVSRGESVDYFATGAYRAAIERTGARYHCYRNSFLNDLVGLPERLEALSWLLMRTTAEVLEEHLTEMREQRPDYVIADSVAPWGFWLAEILGVPVVTSVVTFAFNRQVVAFAARSGIRPKSARLFLSKLRHIANALRLRHRLRSLYQVRGPGISRLVMGGSALNIVYTSRQFQPCADTFDQRFEFIGPMISERNDAPDFPWGQVRDKVLVYVSLGTLFNADVAFYRSCFEAFESMDFQVILSVGANMSRGSLGAAPANFLVQPHVPQLEVLRRAAAFVTHGGMNSVCESLFHGVPMVVVPQMSEQAIVGRRVEETGAGIYLRKERATADTLRESVRQILSDGTFRRQATLLGDSFRKAGGAGKGADAIFRYTR